LIHDYISLQDPSHHSSFPEQQDSLSSHSELQQVFSSLELSLFLQQFHIHLPVFDPFQSGPVQSLFGILIIFII
jgi:hypothetical protein